MGHQPRARRLQAHCACRADESRCARHDDRSRRQFNPENLAAVVFPALRAEQAPPDLAEWLEKRARKLNRPKSEIMRLALQAQREGKGFESAAARAGDLVGKFSCSKYSSHKRNLRGMGSCKRF